MRIDRVGSINIEKIFKQMNETNRLNNKNDQLREKTDTVLNPIYTGYIISSLDRSNRDDLQMQQDIVRETLKDMSIALKVEKSKILNKS